MTTKRKPDWAQKKANRMYRAWRASGRPVPAATIARALRVAYRKGYGMGYTAGVLDGRLKEGAKNV